MAAPAQLKERTEHKPLPLPNTDFHEGTETLNTEELTILKQMRAFMKAKVAPVITTHWAEDSFPFGRLPGQRARHRRPGNSGLGAGVAACDCWGSSR